MFGNKDKKSFFERITGSISVNDQEEENDSPMSRTIISHDDDWFEKETEEIGELAIDVCEKPNEIVVQAMIAGVRPENINIDISRESITIEGKRERMSETTGENYHTKELYWGSFARTITLPAEVDPDGAEAFEKHGLLTIKLPRIDKDRTQKVKIRTI
jgi:HSP20 family molecular chaperone IbpA